MPKLANYLHIAITIYKMADPTTQSNYLKITSKHISFDWTLDFEKKTVAGSAVHDLIVKEDGVKEVV